MSLSGRIAVVMKGYPRLSETFIAQELFGLERRGLALEIWALRRPTDGAVHPVHREIAAPVRYLPEYLADDPARVRAARRTVRKLPGYAAAQQAFAADLARDPSPGRRRRFGQAAVLAAELADDVAWLYAHYLHAPASVVRYAAAMRGLPFAYSAHAKDIYTTPAWDLAEKIRDAAWGVTCTGHNRRFLAALADRPERIELVHHGLDLSRFPAPSPRAVRKGAPLTILSVCRAVEKKGLDDVLHALARLPANLAWRFEHVGGGALVPRLEALAARLGIAERVAFLGAMPRDGVLEAYGRADVFVLASRIAKTGDRDGLPNVVMEAMAMGLPVVSTKVSALPEIVTDETGVLVTPRDRDGLSAAIAALAGDRERRRAMGVAGARRVRASFSAEPGLDRLAQKFAASPAAARAA